MNVWQSHNWRAKRVHTIMVGDDRKLLIAAHNPETKRNILRTRLKKEIVVKMKKAAADSRIRKPPRTGMPNTSIAIHRLIAKVL